MENIENSSHKSINLNLKELNENYYKINSRKRNDNRSFGLYELNSARSFKLNFTDFNKYMNHLNNINNNRMKMNTNRANKISLNKYFNLDKIKIENKDINNNNSRRTLYYRNNNNNKMRSSKYNSFNSYINKKNKTTFISDLKNIYNETGEFLNENICDNINKIKKEKKLLNFKNILGELKLKNFKLETELALIKEKNINLENSQNIRNKKIFITIKNILNRKIKNFDNININNQLNDMNNMNKENPFDLKMFKSLSYKEKINFIRKIYFEEKLKNSLIDKTEILYLKSHNKDEKILNGGGEAWINLCNVYKWILAIIENFDKIKKTNDKIQKNINKLLDEKEMNKKYYNNWINIFGINDKEELIKTIDSLIDVKNINENEKARMLKILMNKKK